MCRNIVIPLMALIVFGITTVMIITSALFPTLPVQDQLVIDLISLFVVFYFADRLFKEMTHNG